MSQHVLEGIRCPECQSEQSFRMPVTITGYATVTDEGFLYSDVEGEYEFQQDAYVYCNNCEHKDFLNKFRPTVEDLNRVEEEAYDRVAEEWKGEDEERRKVARRRPPAWAVEE